MRAALLSDVHANLPALRAALEVADRAGADRLVVAGDLVGDGPHPVEVLALLRERGPDAVRGNVDRKVLALGDRRGRLRRRLAGARGQKANRVWTALRLLESAPERAWLEALPAERTLSLGGLPVLLVHGSPLGDTDYVYPSLTARALRGKLDGRAAPRPAALVCGHSHVPFARRVDGVLVVNCGSVGRPADGDPRGSLALLELADGGARVQLVRFPYPVDEVADALRIREVPGIEAEEYGEGVKRNGK